MLNLKNMKSFATESTICFVASSREESCELDDLLADKYQIEVDVIAVDGLFDFLSSVLDINDQNVQRFLDDFELDFCLPERK